MRAQITLNPSKSKRLIAKGVVALPNVIKALKDHTIILAGGTTNGFIAEELLGIHFEKPSYYTIGIIAGGKPGLSMEQDRIPPMSLLRVNPGETTFTGNHILHSWKLEIFSLKAVMLWIIPV